MEHWEEALLHEARVAVLGTIGPRGEPHLVPVCYALHEGAIVIAADEKPKRPGTLARFRNVARDPRCTLLVQRYSDDWAGLAWVRIEGTGALIETGRTAPLALAALRARYAQYAPMDLESRMLLTIETLRVVSWRWTP